MSSYFEFYLPCYTADQNYLLDRLVSGRLLFQFQDTHYYDGGAMKAAGALTKDLQPLDLSMRFE